MKAKLILALFELGTSHNRWYVERTVSSMLKNMSPQLIERQLAEIRVTSFNLSGKIIHMEQSIGYNRKVLPPQLLGIV